MGLKFFSDFKSGQSKTHISNQDLSFKFTFQIRTLDEKLNFLVTFSFVFFKLPKIP